MTNGTSPERNNGLHFHSLGAILSCGVFSLGAYWAWIFVIYSSAVINPFGNSGISHYCLLNVLAAGCSALCMLLTSLFPRSVFQIFKGFAGTIMLSIASLLSCLPALLARLGITLNTVIIALLWALSACASSIILLKTGRFFVWLKRERLSHCISASFLIAAVFYTLPQLIYPIPAIIFVMLLPLVSCLCTTLLYRSIENETPESVEKQRLSYKSRMGEMKTFAPLTLLYTISFGLVSYHVLTIAMSNGIVFIIVASICASSLFLAICVFAFDVRVEKERFRRALLLFAAIALLPYPYLSAPLKVIFLSLAVFGFTCFDAVGWGDLADEVRERSLDFFTYTSIPTFINFTGIFIGWGMGAALFSFFGAEGFGYYFGILAIVLVALIVLYLTYSNFTGIEEQVGVAEAASQQNTWAACCEKISSEHGLTAQEGRVFSMLARGYSYSHIADELVISGHTVKTHVYHIYRKLDVHSQQDLITFTENEMHGDLPRPDA